MYLTDHLYVHIQWEINNHYYTIYVSKSINIDIKNISTPILFQSLKYRGEFEKPNIGVCF